MDKVAKLKAVAKNIASNRAFQAGVENLASDQIAFNKRSERSKKGWETRRSTMSKEASEKVKDNADVLVRSFIHEPKTPKGVLLGYLKRKTLRNIGGKSNEQINKQG